MPSVWKRPLLKRLRRSLRRRNSNAPRSNKKRRNKQNIEHPSSPSSILQIEEIQHHEVPEQSSQRVSMDDEISRLTMPPFIEDTGVRPEGVTEAINEERLLEVGTALPSEQGTSKNERREKSDKMIESDSSNCSMSQEIECLDEADMEVSSNGSTAEENHSLEELEPGIPYNRPSEVPAKSMDIIGRRVKVRDSLSDPRKRGKIGFITGWKDSITVTMACENGDSFGVRVANVEFAGNSGRQSQFQSEMTQDRTQSENTTVDDEVPVLSSEIDSTSAFPYRSPSEVPGNCPSIIGMKVKVRESLSDSSKRGKVGVIVEWKTRNTVSLKCQDGKLFGVRLSSINFVNDQTQSNTIELPSNEMNEAANALQDDTFSCGDPKFLQSVKSHSTTETFVTARMNCINSSDESDLSIITSSYRSPKSFQSLESRSTTETFVTAKMNSVNSSDDVDVSSIVTESNSSTPAICDEEVVDKIVVSAEKLKKAPLTNETSATDESVQNSRYKEPIDVPAKDEFIVGKRVKVTESLGDSKKRGKIGNVVDWKTKSTVEVACDNGVKFGVRLENIHFVHGHEPQDTSLVAGSTPKAHQKQPGPKTTNTTKPRKENAGKKQSKPRRKKGNGAPPAPSAEAQEWIAPQTIIEKGSFWGIRNAKIVLPGDPKDENCFLKHILEDQRLSLEVPLKKGEPVEKAIRTELQGPSGNYEMVSAKIFDEKSNYGWHSNSKYARVTYAAASSSFSIRDQLLRIADFTSLNPRKIAARLELLQSPTRLDITHHDDSLFREIPDLGYVGGGFIHEDKLAELLETAGMGPTAAGRAVAIQVRIFIPSMGIFKGMLVKKRTKNGAPIELPWSMKKVMASTHPERFKGAKILINKHKVHPSSGNFLIGKKLDPSQDDPADKTLKEKIKKPLSKMVFRLWETLGVPADLCERYGKESLEPDRRNHAWLVGVPDPTGSLPPDTIFVPGIHKKNPYDIFVTRPPCYAREHGRKFRAITQKPHGMLQADWDWLNKNISFGVIIFSNPRPGKMSIPERIASGDLDGDLYLVCWDKEVVDSMTRVVPLVNKPPEDDGKLSTVPSDPEWFSKSQKMHIEKLRPEYSQLVGSLYKLAENKADESDQKLDDPDVRALYNAYNEALEYTKHGRPIHVPRHLIEELKEHLQPFVQPID